MSIHPFLPPSGNDDTRSIGSTRIGEWDHLLRIRFSGTKYTPDVAKVIDTVRTIKEFGKEFIIKLDRKLVEVSDRTSDRISEGTFSVTRTIIDRFLIEKGKEERILSRKIRRKMIKGLEGEMESREKTGRVGTANARHLSLSLSLQLFHETRGPPWSSNNSRNLLIPARTTMSSTWRERLSNTFLPALIRIRRSSARIKRSSSRNDALSSREDDWECGEKEMATIYGKGKGGRKEREKKRK